MVKQYLGDNYNSKCNGRPKIVLDDTVKNFIVSKKVECGVGCSILTQIIRRDHSNDTVLENFSPVSKISYRQVYKTIKDIFLLHQVSQMLSKSHFLPYNHCTFEPIQKLDTNLFLIEL